MLVLVSASAVADSVFDFRIYVDSVLGLAVAVDVVVGWNSCCRQPSVGAFLACLLNYLLTLMRLFLICFNNSRLFMKQLGVTVISNGDPQPFLRNRTNDKYRVQLINQQLNKQSTGK